MRGRSSGIWNRCARRETCWKASTLPGGGTLRLEVNCVGREAAGRLPGS